MTGPGGVECGRPTPSSVHECRRNMPLPNPPTFKIPTFDPTAVRKLKIRKTKKEREIQKTKRDGELFSTKIWGRRFIYSGGRGRKNEI